MRSPPEFGPITGNVARSITTCSVGPVRWSRWVCSPVAVRSDPSKAQDHHARGGHEQLSSQLHGHHPFSSQVKYAFASVEPLAAVTVARTRTPYLGVQPS